MRAPYLLLLLLLLLLQVPQDLFYTASCAGSIAGQLGCFGLKPAVLNDFLAGAAGHMVCACVLGFLRGKGTDWPCPDLHVNCLLP